MIMDATMAVMVINLTFVHSVENVNCMFDKYDVCTSAPIVTTFLAGNTLGGWVFCGSRIYWHATVTLRI
jgi:hypothetical protein